MYPSRNGLLLALLTYLLFGAVQLLDSQIPTIGWNEAGTNVECERIVFSVENLVLPEEAMVLSRGENLSIALEQISGLSIENGLVFPSLKVSLSNAGNQFFMPPTELFSDIKKGISAEFTDMVLRASLNTAWLPANDVPYEATFILSDRKGSEKYSFKISFTITDRIIRMASAPMIPNTAKQHIGYSR